MTDSKTPEEFFASIQKAQQSVADNASLIANASRRSPNQATSVRVEWLTGMFEDEPGVGPPPDRVAAAALALVQKFGMWYDPVLSPETAVDIAETILGASDG